MNIENIKNGENIGINTSMRSLKTKCLYRYKWQLVDALVKYHGWTRAKANKLKHKQLYAVWYKLGNNDGNRKT